MAWPHVMVSPPFIRAGVTVTSLSPVTDGVLHVPVPWWGQLLPSSQGGETCYQTFKITQKKNPTKELKVFCAFFLNNYKCVFQQSPMLPAAGTVTRPQSAQGKDGVQGDTKPRASSLRDIKPGATTLEDEHK